jgi:N-acetylmuramoyl-L-alanine amidase
VICECGFISNPEEEQLLINPGYQDKIAYNIFSGIISYFYEISMMATVAGP